VAAARDELLTHDLVAYQTPLTQVLSLPIPGRVERGGRDALHGLQALTQSTASCWMSFSARCVRSNGQPG
ncbi:MAG: hypothetical protein QF918_09810, partial [Pirellulaceae bacterium]|nr:hypothetical protein [Pirellulaceae bacterium]MDP6717852.1 hypothetical protein [Pirellulaceae bacterium]